MGKDVSFMQYMRAHGNTPGPTQRPIATGLLSGFVAQIPASLLLFHGGTLERAARFFETNVWSVCAFEAALTTIAGMLYALVFKRAANDRRGGWLFGAAFGFLLWMLTPVALWQIITAQPVVTGTAAKALFGARIFYGLLLGLIYPRVHALLQKKLKEPRGSGAAESGEQSGGRKLTPERRLLKQNPE
jgi:tetrahydromethanopterin S-methyltransferase subunit G